MINVIHNRASVIMIVARKNHIHPVLLTEGLDIILNILFI